MNNMNIIKKKSVKIFSNGSIITSNTFFKQNNEIKIYEKDHLTFIFYKKKSNTISDSKSFINFRTKFLKF